MESRFDEQSKIIFYFSQSKLARSVSIIKQTMCWEDHGDESGSSSASQKKSSREASALREDKRDETKYLFIWLDF